MSGESVTMNIRKEAFITVLTSENYKEGLIVTYLSLRKYSCKEFVVLVNASITEKTKHELKNLGITILNSDDIPLEENYLSERMIRDRWFKTLFKLRIFGVTKYEKLVYLDSDLLICGNIDVLFEKENFSAVSDSVFLPKLSRGGLNAGVICFEPSKDLEKVLIDLIPKLAPNKEIFGDQDILNAYLLQWEKDKNKHLDIKFNACFYEIDHYIDKNPLVVHFILENKPWMWSKKEIYLKKIKYFLLMKCNQLKYLNIYFSILNEVR